MSVDWNDAESLARLLQSTYPDVDPRVLAFADLSEMIAALPGASENSAALDEKLLEAIQLAWFEDLDDEHP